MRAVALLRMGQLRPEVVKIWRCVRSLAASGQRYLQASGYWGSHLCTVHPVR